jgi:chemotaxis protein methyltransferase CheR
MTIAIAQPSVLIDADQYSRVQRLLQKSAGITLGDAKHQMVHNRIAKDMRLLRLTSVGQYLDFVENDPAIAQKFINALTTNVTSFYRESHHHQHWISHVTKLVSAPASQSRPLFVWSAGCSTGEEPVSLLLALVGAGLDRLVRHQQIQIFGSDINDEVIAFAKAGIYEERHLISVPKSLRAVGFEQVSSNQFKVKDWLLGCISYDVLNLNAERWRLPIKFAGQRFDAVFCRNVMIYFSLEQQRQLLMRLHGSMAAQALLFTGHSEMLLSADNIFHTVGHTVFQKLHEKFDK